MRAKAKERGASAFSTSVEVDVDIDPDELQDAGWVYVGDEDRTDVDALVSTIRHWHDCEHDAPWKWCSHEVCEAAQ